MFYEDIANLFLKRLTELRLKKGVSSRDMSLSLGQNKNYINTIENKRSLPSMSGFFYICEYLDISPADFFNNENDNKIISSEIQSAIESLNENEVNLVIELIKTLAKNKVKEDNE